jgi:hypothetical protein
MTGLVIVHQRLACEAMHLPLSPRHHGSYGVLDPGNIPGARIGNGNILLNDSTTVLLVFPLVAAFAVPDPFHPGASFLRASEDLIVEGVS